MHGISLVWQEKYDKLYTEKKKKESAEGRIKNVLGYFYNQEKYLEGK